MEDEILIFCENEKMADYAQLVARFGNPGDVAEDFFAGLDVKVVSRFAYGRLRVSCLVLAVVLVSALSVGVVRIYDYCRMQQLVSNSQAAETFVHPNGTQCDVFYVKTQHEGHDVWWEYHTCNGKYLYLSIPPKDSDGTEPYATDIYLNYDGTIVHWTRSENHMMWIQAYDTRA